MHSNNYRKEGLKKVHFWKKKLHSPQTKKKSPIKENKKDDSLSSCLKF